MRVVESFTGRLVEEGAALVEQATGRGFAVRLLGGVGIRVLLGDRLDPALERPYRDIDLLVGRRDARQLEALLAERGWAPAREFNALNGARRLLFHDPHGEAQIDVFVERFEMCHALPLADGLAAPGPSLPATDLLLTKLQIVELNAKDRGDCQALLAGCDIGDGHRDVDPARIAALTGADWGLHHTIEINLARLREHVPAGPAEAVEAIAAAMEAVPKSRSWRMRAKIGERRQWYDDPEEVDRG